VGVVRNDVTNRSRPWDRVLQLIPLFNKNIERPGSLGSQCSLGVSDAKLVHTTRLE